MRSVRLASTMSLSLGSVPDQRITMRRAAPWWSSSSWMVAWRRGQASSGRRSRARMLTRRSGQGWKRQAQRCSRDRCSRAWSTARAVAMPSPEGPTCFWTMWPEASAARSQLRRPSSRSMCLSPTGVRTKGMPAPVSASSRPPLLMTVPTTPGSGRSSRWRSWASSQSSWSPSTRSPSESTMRQRSPSPSKAMPATAPSSWTLAESAFMWVEPTPTLIRGPSAGTPSQWIPLPRSSSGAQGAVAPWAQSTTRPRSSGRSMPPRWRM